VRLIVDPSEFQAACAELRAAGHRLGLVPTMGALHEGHLSLVRGARQHAERVAVSIFVNPTQFGPNEDLARYPRTLERDLEKCRERGVDLVFAPEVVHMYAKGESTRVSVGSLGETLCGASRPNHFDGVCTVVTKLFQLAGPCTAVFGRKDYQQWKIVERMTADLFIPVTVRSMPIVREADGLALSSRNVRLLPGARAAALGLVRGLARAQGAFIEGMRDGARLRELALLEIEGAGLEVDYVSLVDPDALTALPDALPERVLLAAAAFAGDVRLIDNVVLGEDPRLPETP
jgi:pantoate--beta-alanine ligase